MYTIKDLYDLDHTIAADYLRGYTYPWTETADKLSKRLYIIENPLLKPINKKSCCTYDSQERNQS